MHLGLNFTSMVNIKTVASYGKILASRNFVRANASSVKCSGTGTNTATVRNVSQSRITIHDRNGNYQLRDPSRCGTVSRKVSRSERWLQRIAPREKKLVCCHCNKRFYSNEKVSPTEDNKPAESEWGSAEGEKLIVKLEENNLDTIKDYDSLLVYFYTSWCSHCKKLKSVYGAAAIKMKEENVPGRLAAFDLTERMDVAEKFNIISVPKIYYFKKGELMKSYNRKRTPEDIVEFMKSPPDEPSILELNKIDI